MVTFLHINLNHSGRFVTYIGAIGASPAWFLVDIGYTEVRYDALLFYDQPAICVHAQNKVVIINNKFTNAGSVTGSSQQLGK